MRRIPADAVIAVVLLAVCGVILDELMASEGSGAFVKTTTLPMAAVVLLGLLSVVMLVGAAFKVAPTSRGGGPSDGSPNWLGLARVGGTLVWMVVFVTSLPLVGYIISTAIFLVGANILYGNRNPMSIAVIAVVVPFALQMFFEKFMIILLPSSRLFG